MKGISQVDPGKISSTGLMVTLGLVFANIGTSPLYTFKAVLNNAVTPSDVLILGSASAIFWTLTLLATIKYIVLTIRADNRGEGGIFALFALLRRKTPWAAIITIIGGSALLADGILTPAITVTTSIEGFRLFNSELPVVPIVIAVFFIIFFVQQFGINFHAWSWFGPVMLIWFLMIGILGGSQIVTNPGILKAVNPVWAFRFILQYPGGFVLLGFVFLCITGAESIYSDLGHCGRRNIRVTWIFVKLCLILSYFGQAAWLMSNDKPSGNPFFAIMPQWFLVPGIIVSAVASVIATQAVIRSSFTLFTEAVMLNFWPKIKILNPTDLRGQVYLPFVNWTLLILCSFAVLFFRKSDNMEVAYGLSIAITMLMSTVLLISYINSKGVNFKLAVLLLSAFLVIEGMFLVANLEKFMNGGWFTLLLASFYFLAMFSWYFGRKIKNRRISFIKLDKYLQTFKDLSVDATVPKYATNLVYIIKANNQDEVESKVIYSIFNKQPKRADHYWLLHIDMVNDPYRCEYRVNQIIPDVLIRIDFHIGFKVDPKINLYFREVIRDLVRTGEIKLESGFDSLRKHGFPGDFKFVILERIMLPDFKLRNIENFILTIRSFVRRISISDAKAFQLDPSNTIVEQVPIILDQTPGNRIQPITR